MSGEVVESMIPPAQKPRVRQLQALLEQLPLQDQKTLGTQQPCAAPEFLSSERQPPLQFLTKPPLHDSTPLVQEGMSPFR